jgi:2-polyprenyl-3-methyl-5-hydroxy-6-metoxy-1,4-benzoquinol methylase
MLKTDSEACQICGSQRVTELRSTAYPGHPKWYHCDVCRSLSLRPQPDDARLAEIYGPEYYEPWAWEAPERVLQAKGRTFARALEVARPRAGQRLLDVGCAQGEFAATARGIGLDVFGVDLNPQAVANAAARVPGGTFFAGEINAASVAGKFDLITMFDFLEHVRDPIQTLRQAVNLLEPDGSVLISTPRVGSGAQRLMGRLWPQYREEHLHLLSLHGLQCALSKAQLAAVRVIPTTKYLTGSYLLGQLAHYSTPRIEAITRRIRPLNRVPLMHCMLPLRFGEMIVLARRNRAVD